LEINTKSHFYTAWPKVFSPLYALAAIEVSGWPSGGSNLPAPAKHCRKPFELLDFFNKSPQLADFSRIQEILWVEKSTARAVEFVKVSG
jgi:hypothetical protein